MQKLVIVGLVLAVAAVFADDDHYDSKYDDFDADSVIGNVRLMKGYAQCFLDTGNCTPDGKNFKKWIPEAVDNTCEKCTPKQKILVRKVIHALKEQLPEEYEQLLKKYDPEGSHHEKLEKFLQETD